MSDNIRVERADNIEGIGDGRAPPAAAVIAEIASRRALIELQLNAGGPCAGKLAGHVPAHLTGNVRIQDYYLIRRLDQQRLTG